MFSVGSYYSLFRLNVPHKERSRKERRRQRGVKNKRRLGWGVPVVGGYKLPNGLRVVGEVKVYNLSALLLVDDAQRPLLGSVHLCLGGSINPTWEQGQAVDFDGGQLFVTSTGLLANRTVKLISFEQ